MSLTNEDGKRHRIRTLSCVIAAVLAGASAPAWSAAAAGGPAASDTGLDEIVVTARKREERVQDVPIAVSAFDAGMMARAQIANVRDFDAAVPGLTISPTQGSQNSANVFIRGIGQDLSTILTESAVGIYVDGVYLARQIGGLMDLADIERVEVLRGPQGTLYGRNNIGGAVKLETRRPSTDGLDYKADVTVGSFQRVDVRGAVNLPLSDTVAASLSVLTRNDAGYYTNPLTGEELNAKDTQTIRGALAWNASERFALLVSADYSRDRSGFQVGTPYTSLNPDVAVPVYGDPYYAAPGIPDTNRFSGWGGSVRMEWTMPYGTWTSITAFRKMNYVQAYDLSGTPFVAPPNFPGPTQKLTRTLAQDQTSQELQFNSTWEGPLSLVAGVYWFREQGDENLGFVLAPGVSLPFIADQVSKSIAAYAEATYRLSDRWSLTAGGRYTKDDKDLSRDGVFAGITGDYSKNDFTPRVMTSFKPADDAMLYASYAKGYQSGEFQPFPSDPAAARVATNPQNVEAIEVGAKTEWFDNRLRLNLSAFRNDYTDLAVGVAGNGNLVEQTSADVRVEGIELEWMARASEHLMLSGHVAKLDSKYTRAPGGANNPQVGDEAKNTPPLTVRVAADYTAPAFGSTEFVIGGTYTYTDEYYCLVPNIPWYRIDSKKLLDARIGLQAADGRWGVELGGKNLTDELYALQTTILSGPMRYNAPGRTWSLQFRMKSP
jgi:iron complex outermembrane receptor protein